MYKADGEDPTGDFRFYFTPRPIPPEMRTHMEAYLREMYRRETFYKRLQGREQAHYDGFRHFYRSRRHKALLIAPAWAVDGPAGRHAVIMSVPTLSLRKDI